VIAKHRTDGPCYCPDCYDPYDPQPRPLDPTLFPPPATREVRGFNWSTLRRLEIPEFVTRMAQRHPELERQLLWDDVVRIANRERVHVRLVSFPAAQRGRLVRSSGHLFMQLNRTMSREERTVHGCHELVHLWRDDPGVGTYYSDELTGGPRCAFADVAAWFLTTPHRSIITSTAPPSQRLPRKPKRLPSVPDAEDAIAYTLRRIEEIRKAGRIRRG